MKNLFLIDGASGTGKSDLIKYLMDFSTNVSFVRKYTTREKRNYEKINSFLDLIFITDFEFIRNQFKYQYSYSGCKYGFHKSDIYEQLLKYDNVFVIVRNPQVTRQLMSDFHYINVVPVFVYTDKDEIIKRLQNQDMSEDQIKFRLDRLQLAYEDYLKNSQMYMHVLINKSSKKDYRHLIDEMLKKYSVSPIIDEKLIFILMSFNPNNSQLEDYSNAMKRAVADVDLSLKCNNLEDITGSFKISDEAKKKISLCRLAIVDLTENKPNVFYELGYAHAINKEVIITAHEDTDILFYPGEYKVVRYKNSTDLFNKLKYELKGVLGY